MWLDFERMASGRPVQSGFDPRRRLVVAHTEYAVLGLNSRPGAPAGDEGAGERGLEEIDRDSIVQHAAHPGWGDGPAIGAAHSGQATR